MSAIPRWMVKRWQRVVAEHRRPWCPICQRRLCWEQAEARGQLIAHGLPLEPPQRPAVPDDRRSKEHNMSEKLNWRKPNRCDNSGPNCVEVAHDEVTGDRYVRNSTGRSQPVAFTADEWAAFEGSIRAGQQF